MTQGESGAAVAGPLAHPLPWLLVGALIYLSFGYTEMMGSDLWWHVAAGREIVEQGTLWLVDDWSYTKLGEPWHNHEWLADLIFHGWVSLFGMSSLVLWKWLLIVGTFALLQSVLQRLGDNRPAALLAAGLAAAVAAPFLDIRPQLYTLLGCAVLLQLTLLREARLRELLPLFLVWANLHGGFVFGLMMLAVLVFPWRALSPAALRRPVIIVLACAAVCLLNPDGPAIFWLPLVYALNADSPYRSLGEWRSPFEAGGIASDLYLYTLVMAPLMLFWLLPGIRRRIPVVPEAIALTLLTAAMSATSRRFIILYGMAFALLLTPFAAAVFRARLLQPAGVGVLALGLAWGVYRLAPLPLRPDVAFHYLTAAYAFPHGIAEFVDRNGLAGDTFAYYNWGGYLHLRGDGALKVFIDGRANTLFDDAGYHDYVSVLGGRGPWFETLEASGAQFVLWPRGRGGQRIERRLTASGDWQLLYRDARGLLLAHREASLPPTLRLPREGLHAQLTSAHEAMRRGDYAAALIAAQEARREEPWNHGACMAEKAAQAALGQRAESAAVIASCREWFPSRYLR